VACRRADERQIKVGILQLRVVRVDFVDEEGDAFLIPIGVDGVACTRSSACSARSRVSRQTDLECRTRLSRPKTTPAGRRAIRMVFGRPGEEAWCAERKREANAIGTKCQPTPDANEDGGSATTSGDHLKWDSVSNERQILRASDSLPFGGGGGGGR
jgi:hypothetical protein